MKAGGAIMPTRFGQSRSIFAAVALLLALTGCSDEPTTPDPPARTAIHRLFSQPYGDHLYGTDPDEGAAAGYVLEGLNYFYLLAAPAPGHVPLYRCLTPSTPDHFLSTLQSCEGATNQGLLGYIATTQISGTVPLYRLYRYGWGNTFYTLSAAEADNAVVQYSYTPQGVTGYVYTTP
jgi:hypothetical protein